MYLSRDIDSELMNWKQEAGRKPLLLRGVRQCGKTSVVRNLSQYFDSYIEINFELNSRFCTIFEKDFDIRRILSRLELETGKPVIPGQTLLFLDEIQTCPRAVTALRYFYEQMPDLHVVAAGSLLEIALSGKQKRPKIDFPVGRIRSIFLYPFSFREFLRGIGKPGLCDYLDGIDLQKPENDMHHALLEAYKTFLVVGGMPEAVAAYRESGSFLICQRIHRDIVISFMDDFNKYDSNVSPDILRKTFDYALHNVCCQTKASSAIQGVSAYLFDESIDLLRRAGIVYPVKATSCETIPLGSTEKETNKKLLVFDTGVYLTQCRLDTGGLLSAELFEDMNRGSVVEMQTGLELIKNADTYFEAAAYYWYRTGANAEVDYVIQCDDGIIPIEVKASGKGSMQSMAAFLSAHPLSPYGIRASLENFTVYDKIHVFPVYAVYKLPRKP